MAQETPRQTREGSLIEEAVKASGLSVKKLAANAGMSDTRWRHIVTGWQPAPGGARTPVTAPAKTLARMAFAVGVTPEELAKTGRTDAADLLTRILSDNAWTAGVPYPHTGTAGMTVNALNATVTITAGGAQPGDLDEIDMIAASTTMTARQKLERIRLVLALRAQAEAEEAQAREQQEAAAPDAEASLEQS